VMTCPWCDEDASALLVADSSFQCPACGTCVDLVEEDAVLELAA